MYLTAGAAYFQIAMLSDFNMLRRHIEDLTGF
jgi:hypothetical protein